MATSDGGIQPEPPRRSSFDATRLSRFVNTPLLVLCLAGVILAAARGDLDLLVAASLGCAVASFNLYRIRRVRLGG
jgi:hypothetical protein